MNDKWEDAKADFLQSLGCAVMLLALAAVILAGNVVIHL